MSDDRDQELWASDDPRTSTGVTPQPGVATRPTTAPQMPPFMPPPVGLDVGTALTQLQGSVNTLMGTLTPEQQSALHQRAEFKTAIDKYEKTLSPWGKIWKVLVVIGGAATVIFGIGVGYQKAIGDNATKDDIKQHVEIDLVPVQAEVKALKEQMEPVKTGVQTLVDVQEQEQKVKKVRRLVERHDQQYGELLQEYTADKAAGRRGGQRPTKTPEHLKLEDDLEELEGKL